MTQSSSPLRTRACDLLGCDYPVVLAGMGGVARSELVAAVTQAGGFGFLGMVRESAELIRREIMAVRAATARPFGVNLIPAATDARLLEREVETCIELAVPAVTLFWDIFPDLIRRFRKAGTLVVVQAGSAAEAMEAERAGAQIIIAQGVEAGGHVRGLTPLGNLLPEVVAAVSVPVLAAGGLADGRDLAAVLAQGAQGGVFGTRFIATPESFADDYHKMRIVEAKDGDALLTEIFHINWPIGARVRVLPNSVTRGERGDDSGDLQVIGDEEGRPIYLFSTDSPLRSMTGDFEAMALYAGGGAGRIGSIVPAADLVRNIVAEAERTLEAAS